MVKPPGDGNNYFLRVVAVFIAIAIMLCSLLYFMHETGIIDSLMH